MPKRSSTAASITRDELIQEVRSHMLGAGKRPRDANQLAKLIVDQATGIASPEQPADDGKNPAAVALGRLGGLKGGKARAASMSKKRRAEIATLAAQARWKKRR